MFSNGTGYSTNSAANLYHFGPYQSISASKIKPYFSFLKGETSVVECGTECNLKKGVRGSGGRTGTIGPKGELGPVGLKGHPGGPCKTCSPGPSGVSGMAGFPGMPGIKGRAGSDGDPGPEGAKGIPGEKGETGNTGTKVNEEVKVFFKIISTLLMKFAIFGLILGHSLVHRSRSSWVSF